MPLVSGQRVRRGATAFFEVLSAVQDAGGAAYADRNSADGGGDCTGVRDPLCASGQCLIFAEDRTEGCCGEYDSGDADAGPACEPPADAREQGRETAAEEEGGHEDGVGPV